MEDFVRRWIRCKWRCWHRCHRSRRPQDPGSGCRTCEATVGAVRTGMSRALVHFPRTLLINARRATAAVYSDLLSAPSTPSRLLRRRRLWIMLSRKRMCRNLCSLLTLEAGAIQTKLTRARSVACISHVVVHANHNPNRASTPLDSLIRTP
jgi:hypothetical protein